MKRFLLGVIAVAFILSFESVYATTLVGLRYNQDKTSFELHTIDVASGLSTFLSDMPNGIVYFDPLELNHDKRSAGFLVDNTLHEYNLTNGNLVTTTELNRFYLFQYASPTSVVSMSYNTDTQENELYLIEIGTGRTTLLRSFSFDSGSWNTGSFMTLPEMQRAFALSGANTLYEFDLTNGNILSTRAVSLPPGTGRYELLSRNSIAALAYNDATGKNELYTTDIDTGRSTLLKSFTFDTGYYSADTFTVNRATKRAYVMSSIGTLYEFDLTNGNILSTRRLDGPYSGARVLMETVAAAPQALYLDFDGGRVNYRGDSFYMPGAVLLGGEIKTITEMVAKIFAPFNISVSSTLSSPPPSPYSTVYIGGDRDFLKTKTGVDSWWLLFWGDTTVGQAESVDVRNSNRDDNALVLSGELSDASNINLELISQVTAHEAGHLLGLFHVDRLNQLMYPCSSTNIAITNSFYRVANAGSKGCPDLDYALISNVNNYLALGKYVGLDNGGTVDYDDGWWDTFIRRITLDPVWASSTIVYDAKLAVLYSDDAGPTIFNIGDLRSGDTYEVEAPITDFAKFYIYGSSAPGGAVDMYGSANNIMQMAPSDLNESDLADYARVVQEWRIYQHVDEWFTEIGAVEVEVEVGNKKCDTNLDGRFGPRDVSLFVRTCRSELVLWPCDLNDDGRFSGRDVLQYVKDCKRM